MVVIVVRMVGWMDGFGDGSFWGDLVNFLLVAAAVAVVEATQQFYYGY